MADGRGYAYKSQLPPLVEREFYAAAVSDLLPRHLDSGRLGDCSTLLVEWIDGPTLADLAGDEVEKFERVRTVVDLIGRIGGDPPVYLDVGTAAKWAAEADLTLAKLRQLHDLGRFSSITPAEVDRIEEWSGTAAVLETIDSTSRLIHRDLKPEHVLITGDGYRVIDWQVPVIAPAKGVSDNLWSIASGVQGGTGKAEEESDAVPIARRRQRSRSRPGRRVADQGLPDTP